MEDRVVRATRAVVLAAVCVAAMATAAQAATLKIKVSPATTHRGSDYRIKVTGSYQKSELTGRAYLISLIQFSPAPCMATAQLENPAVSNLPVQLYLWTNHKTQKIGVFEQSSPFTRIDGFKAKTTPSTRRVCAYLYPQYIGAGDSTLPIATASAKYRVLK